MSRPRFLADHDLNEHIGDGLRRQTPAPEWVRARDVGLADRPDSELLAYAARHGFVVVSHDVNTMPAAAYDRLARGEPVAGLLMVQQSDPVGTIIEDLLLIWSSSDAVEWHGQVVFLPL